MVLLVRCRLVRRDGFTTEVTVRRRTPWLPPDTYREALVCPDGHTHRDYALDAEASERRGVLVYRQEAA